MSIEKKLHEKKLQEGANRNPEERGGHPGRVVLTPAKRTDKMDK